MTQKPSTARSSHPGIARIRTAMIEKKLTQAELADAADCHEKTIQNLMHGRPVRDQTLFDVCMVLGLDFDELRQTFGATVTTQDAPGTPSQGGIAAPLYMGGYTRGAVDHLIGTYLTLRPAFSDPRAVVAYLTDVTWDPSWPSLLFVERERPDAPYAHRGRLYIPASSMFLHLVSLTKGAMRMIVVSQLDQRGRMRGIVTTLNRRGAQLVPVASPIVYERIEGGAASIVGDIGAEHAAFARYRALLDEAVAEGYARLVP